MPWSCFRPKPQVLTSAEPKVAVEPVVSEPVVSEPVASAEPVVVVKSVSWCKPVACAPVACCKPVACAPVACAPVACCTSVACLSPCKKASESPLAVRSTPESQVLVEKSEQKDASPDVVPAQASSTQASSEEPQQTPQ